MIKDYLNDIIKHTHRLGNIEVVKLIGSETKVDIATVDTDRTVVLTGSIPNPIDKLNCTIGLARMAVLDGYMKLPTYRSDKSTITIIEKEKGDTTIPAELKFDSGDGNTAFYRFMAESQVDKQVLVPQFRGTNSWNLTFKPSTDSIKLLAQTNSILGNYQSQFRPKTNNGTLEFCIGQGTDDRMVITFANDIDGKLNHEFGWPIGIFLSIMKFANEGEDLTVSFSDIGVMKIEVKSEYGEYNYLLPSLTG